MYTANPFLTLAHQSVEKQESSPGRVRCRAADEVLREAREKHTKYKSFVTSGNVRSGAQRIGMSRIQFGDGEFARGVQEHQRFQEKAPRHEPLPEIDEPVQLTRTLSRSSRMFRREETGERLDVASKAQQGHVDDDEDDYAAPLRRSSSSYRFHGVLGSAFQAFTSFSTSEQHRQPEDGSSGKGIRATVSMKSFSRSRMQGEPIRPSLPPAHTAADDGTERWDKILRSLQESQPSVDEPTLIPVDSADAALVTTTLGRSGASEPPPAAGAMQAARTSSCRLLSPCAQQRDFLAARSSNSISASQLQGAIVAHHHHSVYGVSSAVAGGQGRGVASSRVSQQQICWATDSWSDEHGEDSMPLPAVVTPMFANFAVPTVHVMSAPSSTPPSSQITPTGSITHDTAAQQPGRVFTPTTRNTARVAQPRFPPNASSLAAAAAATSCAASDALIGAAVQSHQDQQVCKSLEGLAEGSSASAAAATRPAAAAAPALSGWSSQTSSRRNMRHTLANGTSFSDIVQQQQQIAALRLHLQTSLGSAACGGSSDDAFAVQRSAQAFVVAPPRRGGDDSNSTDTADSTDDEDADCCVYNAARAAAAIRLPVLTSSSFSFAGEPAAASQVMRAKSGVLPML